MQAVVSRGKQLSSTCCYSEFSENAKNEVKYSIVVILEEIFKDNSFKNAPLMFKSSKSIFCSCST